MATPSYWDTVFKYAVTAGFSDVADWITAIRTMLTSTLPVGSRWTESPANTFTSPANSNNDKIVITLTRTSAVRLTFVFTSQIAGAFAATNLQGECDITGTVTAEIMAGPYHFWTQTSAEAAGIVLADTTPEPLGLQAQMAFAKITRNIVQNPFDLHADYWMAGDANVDGGFILRARAQGPWYPVNANTCQMITAAGSYVYFPVVGVVYPTAGANTNQRFIGTFPQFVWVDNSFTPGQRVSVPIDVGVIGVFQVVTARVSNSNNALGPALAVRVA